MLYRYVYTLFLLLLILGYSHAVNVEIGFGKTNLNIKGKIGIEQKDITIKAKGSPTVKHFYINLEFPGTLIPCFKFEYISHTHKGGAGADVKFPVIIKENPLSKLYKPFYDMFDDFATATDLDFYKDITISAVDVNIKTEAEELDFIFYYKFYVSNYFVPKLGIAIKDLNVKTTYTVKVPLFFFKLKDEVEIRKLIPMAYYGFEVYMPLIPGFLLLEWNTEGKEIYAQRNFVLDLKSLIKLRVLSFSYFKNIYIGFGYRYWRLKAKTITKKTKQELTENYRWRGYFSEIGIMF